MYYNGYIPYHLSSLLLKDVFMPIRQPHTRFFISFSLYVWVKYKKFLHCLFPTEAQLLAVVDVLANGCAIAFHQCTYPQCSSESGLTDIFPGHCLSDARGTEHMVTTAVHFWERSVCFKHIQVVYDSTAVLTGQ